MSKSFDSVWATIHIRLPLTVIIRWRDDGKVAEVTVLKVGPAGRTTYKFRLKHGEIANVNAEHISWLTIARPR